VPSLRTIQRRKLNAPGDLAAGSSILNLDNMSEREDARDADERQRDLTRE